MTGAGSSGSEMTRDGDRAVGGADVERDRKRDPGPGLGDAGDLVQAFEVVQRGFLDVDPEVRQLGTGSSRTGGIESRLSEGQEPMS